MNGNICTLFEGDYHYGVGALVNSLYINGFRGTCWAGYRGDLPKWAKSAKNEGSYSALAITPDCFIKFIRLDTDYHLTNYKPDFMLMLWDKYCPNAETIFYFDPDIVNKCDWEFYEEWASYGIALCECMYNYLPSNNPYRLGWKKFAQEQGFSIKRELFEYYNAGFIGVSRQEKTFLDIWKTLQEQCAQAGHISLKKFYLNFQEVQPVPTQGKKYPYLSHDQDLLNLAVMVTDNPLSTFGPEGMNFGKVGGIMCHAAGGNIIKTWRKKLVRQAILGSPPSCFDKLYWDNVQVPIQLYDPIKFHQNKLALLVGSAVGRFIRRTPNTL